MKSQLLYRFTALLAAVYALNLEAHAQTVKALAASPLTLTLTISSTGPGTFQRNSQGVFVLQGTQKIPAYQNEWTTATSSNYESISKISRRKYGNSELLDELIAANRIAAPKTGWQLIYVYDLDENYSVTGSRLVARKSGQEDEPLDDIISSPSILSGVYGVSYKYNYNLATSKESTTGSGTWEFVYGYTIKSPMSSEVYDLRGLATSSENVHCWQETPDIRREMWVPGAQRITGLLGYLTSQSDSQQQVLVTGSAMVGASAPVTIPSN